MIRTDGAGSDTAGSDPVERFSEREESDACPNAVRPLAEWFYREAEVGAWQGGRGGFSAGIREDRGGRDGRRARSGAEDPGGAGPQMASRTRE